LSRPSSEPSDLDVSAEQDLPRAEELARLPVVALVGRPNTGKSTLFNRLTRSRRALVASIPGVTRDRNIAVATYGGRRFLAVDTGGFEADEKEEIGRAVRSQSLLAAEEADVIIVLLDGRAGINPLDVALLDHLRSRPCPLLMAVNKIDTPKQDLLESEFYALGIDRLYPISAEHGVGIAELMDAVLARLPEVAQETPVERQTMTSVAIIGRPNVGKSSLLNRLVGYDRSIVTDVPGTTRDAIDTPVSRAGKDYLLVDTAGVRRRSKVHVHLERASVVRALRALERAEVGLLVVDAVEGITEQDARIGGYAWERGRALILVVNKWDAVEKNPRDQKRFGEEIDRRFPSFAAVPRLFVSAKTGEGVTRIWSFVDRVAAKHRARVPTARLNQVLAQSVQQQAPAVVRGKRPRLFYATQVATAPVSIAVFTSAPSVVSATYERYLVNQLRTAFRLDGVPIRLYFRPRERRPQAKKPHAKRRV
jgi:GTP-binding protein